MKTERETILSVLFNDPHIFGYIRNTWSLRSLAKCITEEFHIQSISFRHLQRILKKDMGIRCKRPKLELEHDDLIMMRERSKYKITNR